MFEDHEFRSETELPDVYYWGIRDAVTLADHYAYSLYLIGGIIDPSNRGSVVARAMPIAVLRQITVGDMGAIATYRIKEGNIETLGVMGRINQKLIPESSKKVFQRIYYLGKSPEIKIRGSRRNREAVMFTYGENGSNISAFSNTFMAETLFGLVERDVHNLEQVGIGTNFYKKS